MDQCDLMVVNYESCELAADYCSTRHPDLCRGSQTIFLTDEDGRNRDRPPEP